MNTSVIGALDIGSSKIACIVARKGQSELEVLGWSIAASKGVKRGVIVDLDAAAQSVDNAIRKARMQSEPELERIAVTLGGKHLEGVTSQGFMPIVPRARPIAREDVLHVINHSRQLMMPPDREQVQAIPREFRVDGQRGIQRPTGMCASKLEVVTHIVTAETAAIQNVEKALSMGGYKVEQLVAGPLASGEGVLTPDQMELGCVVVDIGSGKTDMAVYQNGTIASQHVFPVGGDFVTSDIMKLLKTSPEVAELLKRESGHALSSMVRDDEVAEVTQLGQTVARPLKRKVLSEIVECRMRELAVVVRQQLERSGFYALLPAGIFLTGGGSRLTGTVDLFAEVAPHLSVQTVGARVPVGADQGLWQPEFSAAIGVARFALQAGDELEPASGLDGWRERIRTLKALLSGKH